MPKKTRLEGTGWGTKILVKKKNRGRKGEKYEKTNFEAC